MMKKQKTTQAETQRKCAKIEGTLEFHVTIVYFPGPACPPEIDQNNTRANLFINSSNFSRAGSSLFSGRRRPCASKRSGRSIVESDSDSEGLFGPWGYLWCFDEVDEER